MEKFIKFWKQTWLGFRFLMIIAGLMAGGMALLIAGAAALNLLIPLMMHYFGLKVIGLILGIFVIIMVSHELGR